jgi:hypothetical protein
MENLQPLEVYNMDLAPGLMDAYLRIISSGHGWGENNTGNAAEFYNATHQIMINGAHAWDQNLWQACNPNPAGCQPQYGTWYHDRAGWCPGSIPILYRYPLQNYLGGSSMQIQYLWDADYVDYCHPSNPDCISGVTCDNCNAGFDPHIVVAGEFVVLSDEVIVGIEERQLLPFEFTLTPNPASGKLTIMFNGNPPVNTSYSLINVSGQMVMNGSLDEDSTIDISGLKAGLYLVMISSDKGSRVKKLLVE